ncbi:MAG: M20/M25/M40 family metallo-hydrolase [Candidatus Acidiferrales bacterium]
MKRLFDLTRDLVNIESVTGHEHACAEFIARLLADQGYATQRQPVSDGRANVYAARGNPDVILCTHIDTVPPFFPAREDSEFLYGRGACDAKGCLASMIVAAERLIADGVHNFGLLFLVGEETGSDGARVANLAPPGSKFVVVGEPTNNRLVVATKGTLAVRIQAHGRAAHSAYPELGDSAIDRLLDLLAELRAMPLPSDPKLGPSTVNIGLISGGRATNVVPDLAEAQLLYRTLDDGAQLRGRITAVLEGRCEYEFSRQTPILHFEELDGFESDVVAFTTDATHLPHWGRPLLLGPGSIIQAHTENEYVRKAELVRAVDLYTQIVRKLKARIQQPQEATR